jgi:hypothetical protein
MDDIIHAHLPAPIRGAEAGTFAHDTVVRRMPAIVRRVVAENALAPAAAASLAALADEILGGAIRPLRDTHAPDAAAWAAYVAPHAGCGWLDVPWFFAETYMFRRILEATGYFGDGPGAGLDPYALQKRAGLALAGRDEGPTAWLQSPADEASPSALGLSRLIHGSLWGNQADLSLWPAEEGGRPQGDAAPRAERLLADDTAALAAHILAIGGGGRADLVLDNAGLELLGDLALADALLSVYIHVVLHAKPHPTYVSDVTRADLTETLAWLGERADGSARALGEGLALAERDGRLVVRADWFWTSPLAGSEMPAELRADLSRSGVIISKGDANYRRWLGDRHWPYDTPIDRALGYTPAPLALLRTCKSEVAAGIARERIGAAVAVDPEWLTAGRWGVIQFVPTGAKNA